MWLIERTLLTCMMFVLNDVSLMYNTGCFLLSD